MYSNHFSFKLRGVVLYILVLAGMSVTEVRQLYFKMKDAVFGNPKGGVSFNTAALQDLLFETFGNDLCMNDVTSPK